jgi:hypothetical protein
MTQRFSIWSESRIRIAEFKAQYENERHKILREIRAEITQKLTDFEITDDRVINDVIHKYTFHIELAEVLKTDRLLKSHISDSLSPPLIMVGNSELKI